MNSPDTVPKILNASEGENRRTIQHFMHWKMYYDSFKDQNGRAVYGIDACRKIWDKLEMKHVEFRDSSDKDFGKFSCTLYFGSHDVGDENTCPHHKVTYTGRDIEEAAFAAIANAIKIYEFLG